MRRPARTPADSSTALVATVVPCTRQSICAGAIAVRKRSSSASISACDGSAGTEGTLMVRNSPGAGANATRSVNVPPVSTPIIHPDMALTFHPLSQTPVSEPAVEPGERDVHAQRNKQCERHAEIDVPGIEEAAMVGDHVAEATKRSQHLGHDHPDHDEPGANPQSCNDRRQRQRK